MTIYKQYDSRWSKKNYNGSSSIGTAACGPFSVANIIVEHKSINPMDVVTFMQKNGYAIRNKGTAWSGMPAAMKHFGMTDVKAVDVSTSMSKVWEHMKKGYDAVFLFIGGSRGGVCWTTQGHYVAMVGYELKNNKHYLKAKDSGGRDHDGWYCYETQMRGLIPQVWVGKMDGTAPAPTSGLVVDGKMGPLTIKAFQKWLGVSQTGKLDTTTIKAFQKRMNIPINGKWDDHTRRALQRYLNMRSRAGLTVDGKVGYKTVCALQRFLNNPPSPTPTPTPKSNVQKIIDMAKACAYPSGTSKSKYGYPGGTPKPEYKAALQKAYGDRKGWGKATKAGASCDVFVGTVIRACGYDTKFPRGLDGVVAHCKNNPKWTLTGIKSEKDMKPGDIVFQNFKGSGGHILVYLGDGKCANAHYNKAYGIIQKYSNVTKSASNCRQFNVYRVK